MMQMRTHTCNELRLEHVGQSVKLVGWMENVRAVGQNFAFVVLRDFYGTTQIVVETEDMMAVIRDLNKESTISVEGVVRERASKNPKQATGDIEVVPSKIEVLGRCRYNSLPFEINRSREADELQRLKYRYLDLRNPAVKQNIILRCQVVAALRAAMTDHGFLEITTPILTASSPEGARDYLVPARKHPGKFYALPQAPQQFKQLLMTSGFDRYFQIAPCFRDEDARGDPEVHAVGADLKFYSHRRFPLGEEYRNLHYHMITTITIWLWFFDIILDFNNFNIILSGNQIGHCINIVNESTDHPDTSHVI